MSLSFRVCNRPPQYNAVLTLIGLRERNAAFDLFWLNANRSCVCMLISYKRNGE